MEEQFKKAQKPWAKLLEKVDKCKVRSNWCPPLSNLLNSADQLPHGLQEREDCREPRKKCHQGLKSVTGSGQCNCTTVGAKKILMKPFNKSERAFGVKASQLDETLATFL